MEKLIACCGLDCGKCEARIATIQNDEALRRKVAAVWSELNHAQITPEMIRCEGCRADGAKTPFCESMCPIRPCTLGRGYETCAECSEMDGCEKLGMITGNNPAALESLKKQSGRKA